MCLLLSGLLSFTRIECSTLGFRSLLSIGVSILNLNSPQIVGASRLRHSSLDTTAESVNPATRGRNPVDLSADLCGGDHDLSGLNQGENSVSTGRRGASLCIMFFKYTNHLNNSFLQIEFRPMYNSLKNDHTQYVMLQI